MKGDRHSNSKAEGQAEGPEIVFGKGVGDLGTKIREAIAHRAYELFEARGHVHGQDYADWFQAESELVHPQSVKTWQSDREVIVTAELPGLCPEEVTIAVEPDRIIIWGRPDPKPLASNPYPVRASVALWHTLKLPAEVDPSKATAKLTNGLLKLELPKDQHQSGATKPEQRLATQ
jgi:HSP20 family molecular chaperone IbpA